MKNMPRGDGTGPGGLGPMTGRAAGYCAGYSTPGFANPYGGRMGMGLGYGRGYGRAFWPAYPYPRTPPPTAYGGGFYQPTLEPKQEMEMLAEEAKALKGQLEAINKRVSELKETKEK
jgi:hypothetical protein